MNAPTSIQPNREYEAAMQLVAQDKAWRRYQNRVHMKRKRKLKAIRDGKRHGESSPRRLARDFLSDREIFESYLLRCAPEGTPKASIRKWSKDSLWAENQEPVEWWRQRRFNRTPRPICDLPLVLKAKHLMLAEVIVAQMNLHPSIYGAAHAAYADGCQAQSRDAAARRASHLIRSGYLFVEELDIRDFFQSFNPDGLMSMTSYQLPEEVIRKTLDHRSLRFLFAPERETGLSTIRLTERSGPRGLLQGSPASNAILASVLDRVIKDLPQQEDTELVIFADNILVAAREEVGLRTTRDTLVTALQDLPVGPLHLSEPNRLTNEGINFLGYHIDPDGTLSIPESKLEKLEGRLEDNECHTWDECFDAVLVIRDFAEGYRAADIRADQLDHYLADVAQSLPSIGGYGDLVQNMLRRDRLHPHLECHIKSAVRRRDAKRQRERT